MKVRIAVAIDASGKWCAGGWWDGNDQNARNFALDGVPDNPAAVHWVTADVPTPTDELELHGEVEK